MSFVMVKKGSSGMRVFVVALALIVVLAAGPAYAQAPAQPAPKPGAPAGQTPPAQPAPRPAAPPATQPQPAPTPPAVRFQDGLKYAYVNIQQIAAQSSE